MDPNEALKEIRSLAAIVRDRTDRGEDPDVDGAAADLAGRIEALDEWLSRGGFTPDAWRNGMAFTREQVEAWVGNELTDEQIEQIEEALPNTSFPDCVGAVAESLGFLADDEEF